MKRIGRLDPLVLFLAAGLALYLLLDGLGLARGDERLIAVDEPHLNAFLASEGGRLPGRTLEGMSPEQRRKLVDDYVREEALYREARALGLDRADSAIRRRLVQSLRFSLEGAANDANTPSDAELRAYLAAHRDRYVDTPKVSFSHVFFDKAKRGEAGALEAARQALRRVRGADWLAMGDRYPYQRSEVDVTRDALASEMGSETASAIFAMGPAGDEWRGPVESDLGFHLVRIDRKDPGGEPDFAAIRGELVAGLAEEKRETRLDHAIDGIVEGYRIDLSPDVRRDLK